MRQGNEQRHDSGFTLIETIVALMIFVGCYLLLHHSVALGWRGLQAAHSETVALDLAQSLLAQAGIEVPLREGQDSGATAQGFDWTVTVSRHGPDTAPGRLTAFRVAVEVRWRDVLRRPKTLELATIKLGSRS
jgi:general secretion pathway protein I